MAIDTPSIKGSVFARVVEDANKAIAREGLSDAEIGRWLEPGDREVLAASISVARWYDIRIYDRLNALLLELEGHGDVDYWRRQGIATARFLLKKGLYSQLEYLQRTEVARETDPERRFEAFGRDLRLITSLSASILNFSVWSAKPDPGRPRRHRIEVADASAISEALAYRSEGFINGMATARGAGRLWEYERARRDLIVYRMTRDL